MKGHEAKSVEPVVLVDGMWLDELPRNIPMSRTQRTSKLRVINRLSYYCKCKSSESWSTTALGYMR